MAWHFGAGSLAGPLSFTSSTQLRIPQPQPSLQHLQSPEPSTRIMSFGFGFSDIVLVSNGAIKFWTTIHNAPTEQAELAKTHRLLQEVVQRITDYGSVLAPKLSPTTAIALEQQLSLCAKHLHSLEQIATKYMGHSLTAPGLQSKSQRHRLARWGLYKRDEFVQSLEDLRKVVVLLLSYAMFENTLLASLGTPPDCEPLRLMDALNRETVCSISMCDTWEVSYSDKTIVLR